MERGRTGGEGREGERDGREINSGGKEGWQEREERVEEEGEG